MEITKGFQLEQPRLFVPWGLTHQEVEALFEGVDLRPIGNGFHLSHCVSLGGLAHSLGFNFGRTGKLYEIGFQVPGISTEESYRRLQQHLEMTFGPPSKTSPGEERDELPDHIWLLPGIRIEHYVHEHFGPAETVSITRIGEVM